MEGAMRLSKDGRSRPWNSGGLKWVRAEAWPTRRVGFFEALFACHPELYVWCWLQLPNFCVYVSQFSLFAKNSQRQACTDCT